MKERSREHLTVSVWDHLEETGCVLPRGKCFLWEVMEMSQVPAMYFYKRIPFSTEVILPH